MKTPDFKTAFQRAPIGISFLSPDLEWTRISRQFCDMLGYTEEELRQIKYDALVHPDDVQQMRDFYASLLH